MAEFKFFCPQCGQQILCDTGYSGTQINCPACKQVIVVPQAPGFAAPAAQSQTPPTSRAFQNVLAIAASVIVLAGLIAAGWFGYSKYKRGHLPSGLVALWSGEGNANDSVGANNGTLVGEVGFADGKVGQAFSFNGRNSYVSIPDSTSLDVLATSITVMAWIKVNHSTVNSDWEGIVTKGNASWRLMATAGTKTVYFAASGTSSADIGGSRNVNDGQWHHVAGVYDGANLLIYVDGKLDASRSDSGSIVTTSDPVSIGYLANTRSSGHYWLDGLVDEASIYHRGLSASEIQAVYLKQNNVGLLNHGGLNSSSR